MTRIFVALLAIALTNLHAAPVEFTVHETAGLRRFGYPVTASLQLPQGALADAALARLLWRDSKEIAAQFTALSKWPDGSVRALDVDFTSSIGPMEAESYRVEFNGAPRPTGKGLGVMETAEEIIVASGSISHRIRHDGKPLLTSIVNGKTEYIGAAGVSTSLAPGKAEVLKRGPFNVTVRLGPVTLEYVSSKSWVKIIQQSSTATDLSVDGQFAVPELPVTWDLGVESWLYGHFRKANEVALLQQKENGWQVLTGAGEPKSVYATGKHCEGWGHLSDKQHVVAFGVADFSALGQPLLQMGADGKFRATAHRKELIVYFHVVGQPVHVTAVTSPPSMLAPLVVEWK